MSTAKEMIAHSLRLMKEEDALLLLDWINSNFVLSYRKCDWDNIEVIDPDSIDIEMMSDIDTNIDCNEFISINEYMTKRFKR